jgi:hypothetical protein
MISFPEPELMIRSKCLPLAVHQVSEPGKNEQFRQLLVYVVDIHPESVVFSLLGVVNVNS